MPRQKLFSARWLFSLLIALTLVCPALAQTSNSADSALIVTAGATNERVRFTAPATVVQLRLEVLSNDGQILFDAQSKGNVFDWSLQDGSGQRVADGKYLCVVTVKSLSGRLSQRTGALQIGGGQINLQKIEGSQMSPAQQQEIGPVENDSSVSVLEQDEASAVTTVAHNGTDGEIVRSKGALSFRFGDFYSGKDAEQMRLTEEGNLGIGTDNPQARLDVNGVIRAQEGFQFGDGSLLAVSPKGALKVTSPSGKTTTLGTTGGTNIAGTGTQNKIAKWADNDGTLGDSTVSEVNGQVGIGTTTPGGQLHIFGTATQDVFAGMGPDLINGPAFNFGYAGSSFGRGAGFFNVRPDASAVAPNPSLRFATSNIQRMIITNTGNVGIGTSTPQSKLQIAGSANLGGTFNGLFIDQTLQSTAPPGSIPFQIRTTVSTGSPRTDLLVNDLGNVGIGTATPTAAKLVVQDTTIGTAVDGTTSTTGSGVFGQSTGTTGFGVFGQSTGTTGYGVFGQSTGATGYGVYGDAPSGGYAIYANGNAAQPVAANGLVKAMLLVNKDGTINLCYNSQLTGSAATTVPCGFSISHSTGVYIISFPFPINVRFFSATVAQEPGNFLSDATEVQLRPAGSQSLSCFTTRDYFNFQDTAFYLIVY